MRIDQTIRKWLSASNNMQGSCTHKSRTYTRLINAINTNPIGTPYNEDGTVNITPIAGDGSTINLLLNQDRSVYRNNVQNFRMSINPYIEVRPFKGMTIQSRLNAQLGYYRTNYFQGEGSYQYYVASGANSTGTNSNVNARITQNRGYSYKWENIFTYNFNICQDHNFILTGVTSWNHNQNNYSWQYQDNIRNNSYLWHNMSGTGQVSSNYTMSKGMGLVGRLNYSYKSKYLFSASVRHDGSSRLAKGNKWATFPAVSAGWTISEEAFMKDTKDWLSNLKLRAGYGVTGAASIDPYTTIAMVELDGNYTLGGELVPYYRYSQNMSNEDLTWEKSYNWNFGVDVALLKNRIELTADYYRTRTKGVIWSQNIPVNNGGFDATTQYYMSRNIAETKNNGLELALNTRNISTKNFKWNSSLTFTLNNEKVSKLIGGTADHIQNGTSDFYLNLGHFVNSYYTYKLDGIWQKGDAADAAAFGCAPGDIRINVPNLVKAATGSYYKVGDDGQPLVDAAGNVIYYDATNPYAYSGDDYQVIGHNAPKWTLGFQNQFVYKNFDLTIYAYFRWGQMIKYDMLGYYDPTGSGNFPEYFDYWTEDNAANYFPALNASRSINSYTGYSALNFVDGSYFKIKNITLGYTFAPDALRKAGISKCRLYATITNPLVVSKSGLLKKYDPEMNGSFNYPLTRQLVFGLNVSF